jgi:hypothetical protein
MYMQVRQVGEKVIADEQCKHDEIVDYTLEVIAEGQRGSHFSELEVQVLAQETQMEKVEIN